MQATIVQLLQSMNFQTRKTVTYVVLELPNGQQVRAAVDDDTAAAIVSADVGANGAAPRVAGSEESLGEAAPEVEETAPDYDEPPPEVVTETETETVRIFGGEATEAPPKSTPKKTKKAAKKVTLPVPPEPAEAPALPPPAPTPLPEEPRVKPKYPEPLSTKSYEKMVKEGVLPENAYHRTVPAVDGGYPAVIPKAGTADPQDVVGHMNPDEDGVGSC